MEFRTQCQNFFFELFCCKKKFEMHNIILALWLNMFDSIPFGAVYKRHSLKFKLEPLDTSLPSLETSYINHPEQKLSRKFKWQLSINCSFRVGKARKVRLHPRLGPLPSCYSNDVLCNLHVRPTPSLFCLMWKMTLSYNFLMGFSAPVKIFCEQAVIIVRPSFILYFFFVMFEVWAFQMLNFIFDNISDQKRRFI